MTMMQKVPATPAPLMQVHRNAIDRAIKVIAAAGCRFKVIEPDGSEHGELQVIPPKQGKRVFRHPHGTMHRHYLPHMRDVQPNDAALVPFGPFVEQADRESLRSSLCAWASSHWGNDTYETHMSAAGVEVFRFR